MTDRELLKAAATAVGMALLDWRESWANYAGSAWRTAKRELWNPLTDDGDALRLAVQLRMRVESWGFGASAVVTIDNRVIVSEPHYGEDPGRATRRAIVRAAAAMAPSEFDPMGRTTSAAIGMP